MTSEQNEIMAAALEAEAILQEQGATSRLGEAYEATFRRILEVDRLYDDSVAFALGFWEVWGDAARHDWRYNETLTESDWPHLAREIAQDVRHGSVPDNPDLLERLLPEPPKTLEELRAHDPAAVADSLREMEFRDLARFDAGHTGVFWSEAGGPSPWEMHPDCDEMLQVLEGEIEVEVLPVDHGAGVKTRVPAGSFFVVPRGCWHRQNLLTRTKELYLTPGRSLSSTAEDPRRQT